MLDQYYRINHAVGVAIQLNQDGTMDIHGISLTAKNSQLDIDKKLISLKSIADLKKSFADETSLAINLSGKGVLNKQIERTEEVNQSNFNKILPNAKIDDFYVQNFISGEYSFISLIRKTEADKWLDYLQIQGFTALMLSLGPYTTFNIIPQLNLYDQDITFNGNIIKRNKESQWTEVQYDESKNGLFPIKIESETITEQLIIPYAAAFQLILQAKIETIEADVVSIKTALQKKLAENKLKVSGFLVLAVIFTSLLINFALFSWLSSSNDKLTMQVGATSHNASDVQSLNEKVNSKQALLKELGWDDNINKSSLIDQLAALMPEEITLNQIALNPVDVNSTRIQKSLVFFNRQIRISGTSEKIIPVNEWIARIKTKNWVKNIQLDSYAFNGELNTGQFNLFLTY